MEDSPKTILSKKDFITIVEKAPLVSVDLVIIDPMNYCLLGRRKNRPAKGTMFVPGGRILKNEAIDEAINRILLSETGYRVRSVDRICFIAVHEHFYSESFWDVNLSTHYVVLQYRLSLKSRFKQKPDK